MRIGLLADTHDRLPAIRELVRRIADMGAELVLHAGDFCAPFSLMPFHEARVPLAGVFGHNDGDPEGLRAFAARGVGVELFESPHSFDVGGRRILLVHDLADAADRSIESHEIVVHGLLHRQEYEMRGDTLLVNPGEGCGWLHGEPSAAIVDLESRHLEFIRLTEARWKE